MRSPLDDILILLFEVLALAILLPVALRPVRRTWRTVHANPMRIILAQASSGCVMAACCMVVFSSMCGLEARNGGMRVVTVASGLGSITHGDFINVRRAGGKVMEEVIVLGLPGDKVTLDEEGVLVNGEHLQVTSSCFPERVACAQPIHVPADHVAVTGDLGKIGCDGVRLFPTQEIVSHELVLLKPLSHFGRRPIHYYCPPVEQQEP